MKYKILQKTKPKNTNEFNTQKNLKYKRIPYFYRRIFGCTREKSTEEKHKQKNICKLRNTYKQKKNKQKNVIYYKNKK